MMHDMPRAILRFAAAVGVTLCALSNCVQEPKLASTGGETHFLSTCSTSATCGNSLACLCGTCTSACSDSTACQSLSDSAICVSAASLPAANSYPESQSTRLCDVPCSSDDPCLTISSLHRCEAGYCRKNSRTAGSDAGTADAATNACVRGEVAANEVLFIGDSFLATTHRIPAAVEELARQAGALAAGERYRDSSSLDGNALALDAPNLASRYVTSRAEGGVKVVIMNGGGADVLVGNCIDPLAEDCTGWVNAESAAQQLLAQMKQDGVQHVVYLFYPDPVDAVLRARMDLLRPRIQSACQGSPVPCHWLDLRPTFANRYGEYVLPDGMNPTDAGADATAAAIWSTLQTNCIAQ